MSDVTEDTLLDYFYSAGGHSGRVKNAAILKTFKPFIGHSDLQLRAKYREEFKSIIDRIAVVKSENGEKYLILKKKYRHLLQERDTKHVGADDDARRRPSPAKTTATAEWEAIDALTSSAQQRQLQDELMLCGEPDAEERQAGNVLKLCTPQQETQELSGQSNGDDVDRDSGSKPELEQDEESTASMGSAAVALDPIEKEWIYSAASARVPDLSQLLRQDPSLANKKDFTSFSHCPVATADHLLRGALSLCHLHPDKIAWLPLKCREMGRVDRALGLLSVSVLLGESMWWGQGCPRVIGQVVTALHWAAKHGNKDMATLVAEAGADVNTKSLICIFFFMLFSFAMFGPGKLKGGYTPLHIAALHGHQHVIDLLIKTYGAKENLRDYSGHLACHYRNLKDPEGQGEDSELEFQVTQVRERNKNRKLVSLFHSKKKWGSAEELGPIEEETTASHQTILPAFRPRKFSR
ncbi:uncharacterized protein FYW49_004759 [Xenentodon cancila]